MEWNVYYYNFNKNEIEVYNIFKHGSFMEYLKKAYRECKSKDNFSERLRSELRYFYWSKCEWEVLITPWCGRQESCDLKIDVFDQVMLNWNTFVNYVWEHKEDLLRLE